MHVLISSLVLPARKILGGNDKSFYRGEQESIVHVPYTYARNVVYGDDIDTAFMNSISVKDRCERTDASPALQTGCQSWTFNQNKAPQMNIDDAAVDWMVRPNFRTTGVMSYERGETNEIQYQERGHAKYADMARLFGWTFMREFFNQESLDIEAFGSVQSPCALSSAADGRTFRLSLKAGVNLVPLIHFWGVPPDDASALDGCMTQEGLAHSPIVKAQLERYATIVPANQTAFIEHYNKIWPGKFSNECPGNGCPSSNYGCGWYNCQHPSWDETVAAATVTAVEDLVDAYWTSARRLRGVLNAAVPSAVNAPRKLGLFTPGGRSEEVASLNSAVRRWNEGGASDYNFEMELDWYAPRSYLGPFSVEVRAGNVAMILDNVTGETVRQADLRVDSIDGLLGLVESSFDGARYVHAEYSALTGVPEFIYLDEVAEDDDQEDSVIQIFVRNVERL